MTTRRNFSRKTLREGYDRAKGKCEKCSTVLKKGAWHGDHILPDVLGGEPVLANLQILCVGCHAEKTAADIRRTRKADRQRDKETGVVRAKGGIKQRGFAKTEKTRKIDRSALPELPRRTMFETKG